MSRDFFPPRPASRPTIYAYEDTNQQYAGLLKVGYSIARDICNELLNVNGITAVQNAGGRLSEAARLSWGRHPAYRVSMTKPPWKANSTLASLLPILLMWGALRHSAKTDDIRPKVFINNMLCYNVTK